MDKGELFVGNCSKVDLDLLVVAEIDDDGLVAFYPRTSGSVWLTASSYRYPTFRRITSATSPKDA